MSEEKCLCGNLTMDEEGVCIICRINARVQETNWPLKRTNTDTGGKKMYAFKKCRMCGKNFSPAGPRQLDCDDCRKKKPTGKKSKKETTGKRTAPRVARRTACQVKKTEGMKVTLDFSEYPDLWENLADIAHGDMRSPEMQIMCMINEAIQRS